MASTTIFILLLLAFVVLLLNQSDNNKKTFKSKPINFTKNYLDWFTKVTTIFLVILAFLTFLGFDKTASSALNEKTVFYSNDLFQWTVIVSIILVFLVSLRYYQKFQLKRGLRHIDAWYFGRNNVPNRPCGERVIRNTVTMQAYIMDTFTDQLVVSGLIEWYTETDPQVSMNDFLTNEGYTSERRHRRRPYFSELAQGSEFRGIKFLLSLLQS
ncbi:MAG: hypothetical protein M1503_06650 [Thaumarchaeota archaeon]|nr:hypothetical protein [Nitrososphaerota archaeon]MCL5317921.1 hypothetical protein [Nitrososphaerota archaeon]